MKKKISMKLFFTVLWRGLCQLCHKVGKLFGYKEEATFWKVIWRTFAGCATILLVLFTGCVLYAFAREVALRKWMHSEAYCYGLEERHLSNHIVFQTSLDAENGRVYDEAGQKVILTHVDWVVTSDDKDSLAVFSKEGRRGYINRFTGEIAIPPVFTRAWIFSEGLAAAEKDGKLVFIDHDGNVVIDKNFEVHFDNPRYAFRKGYCMVKDPTTGKSGLIDKKGNWALEPIYDDIFNNEGFWQVEKGKLTGLFTADMDTMFTVSHQNIYVDDKTIEVNFTDHTSRRYDHEGNVTVDFVIDEITNLQYETDRLRNDADGSEDVEVDNKVYAIANRMQYKVSGGWNGEDHYGLISRDGKRITPPDYTLIEAVGKNLYLCHPQGVILDDHGEVVDKVMP